MSATKLLKTRITEFLQLAKNYSFIYACYSILWWVCFYTRPPFCKAISCYAIKKKTRWLNRYIEKKYASVIDEFRKRESVTSKISNANIWIFWGQGEENMPQLVKACYKQLKTNNPNVVLVTHSNIKDYIYIPPIVYKKVENGELSWAHFSDIVRNTLLAKQGGLWIDATVWAPNRIPIDRLMQYKFFSPSEKIALGNRGVCFWSSFDYNWNTWCMWSNSQNYIVFSFVSRMLIEMVRNEKLLPDYVTMDYLIHYAIMNFPAAQNDIEKAKEITCDNRHVLATLMNEKYNENRYKELCEKDYFFKLSFRAGWKEKTANGDATYYEHLILANND